LFVLYNQVLFNQNAQAIEMEIPHKAACGFMWNWNGKRGFCVAKMRPK
jgi:hypothetical protein